MKIILLYGSENDKPFMQPARDYMEGESLDYAEEVLSAHRNLSELIDFVSGSASMVDVSIHLG